MKDERRCMFLPPGDVQSEARTWRVGARHSQTEHQCCAAHLDLVRPQPPFTASSQPEDTDGNNCNTIYILYLSTVKHRGGTIPEITMRYVSRYLSHDTIRITILH